MWYNSKIMVTQNKHFYYQEGTSDNKENKVDLTEYEFVGLCGSWFRSFENKEPLATDRRIIFGQEFSAYSVYKEGYFFNRKYKINWTPISGTNTVEDIACFYKENMVRQLPQDKTCCQNGREK